MRRHEHKWSAWVQLGKGTTYFRECVRRFRGKKCASSETKTLERAK